MAKVYLAYDPKLNCHVALKVFENVSDSPQFEELKERFFKEAQILANLNHPNLVRVFDLSTDGDKPFISMEFIDGLNLKQHLKNNPNLDLKSRLKIFKDICLGIKCIHGYPLVHKDIKPENIMITKSGELKIMDFGVAEDFSGDSDLILGTPHFMSPEQLQKASVDARSDIFSIGILACVLFAGFNPFKARTFNEIKKLVIEKEVQLPSKLPSRLKKLINKCLQKEAKFRYQTIEDLLLDLDNTKSWSPTQVLSQPKFLAIFLTIVSIFAAWVFVFMPKAKLSDSWAKLPPTSFESLKKLAPFYAALEGCAPNCAGQNEFILQNLAQHFASLNCGDKVCSQLERSCGLCKMDCNNSEPSNEVICKTFNLKYPRIYRDRLLRMRFDQCLFSLNQDKNINLEGLKQNLVACMQTPDLKEAIDNCSGESEDEIFKCLLKL